MNNEFASANLTVGQINAIVKKLGGHDMALRFLRDELVISESIRSWREEDGVIRFSVVSNGLTGEEWIARLEGKWFRVGDYAKQILLSSDFKPTNGVTTEVAVLKGTLFKDNNRITRKIRVGGDKRGLSKPNPEVACLIREKFTDEEIKAMGLCWIVVMHEPIEDSGGDPSLLGVHCDVGGDWLLAYYGSSASRWNRDLGFAFVR